MTSPQNHPPTPWCLLFGALCLSAAAAAGRGGRLPPGASHAAPAGGLGGLAGLGDGPRPATARARRPEPPPPAQIGRQGPGPNPGPDGPRRLRTLNLAAEELFGFPPAEVLGK